MLTVRRARLRDKGSINEESYGFEPQPIRRRGRYRHRLSTTSRHRAGDGDRGSRLVETHRNGRLGTVAGSVDSGELAVFLGTFPRGDLNFTRGTYVELELRGQGSRVWIDRWDPQITCSSTCADLNHGEDVTGRDYLLVLAEYGQTVDPFSEFGKGCLDSGVSGDFYVDYDDLSAWDTWLNGSALHACGPTVTSRASTQTGSPVTLPPTGALLVAGKTKVAGLREDYLFSTTSNGVCMCDRQSPASAAIADKGHHEHVHKMIPIFFIIRLHIQQPFNIGQIVQM